MIQITPVLSVRRAAMEDAPVIFETIQSERNFLKEWLPFVEKTKEIGDTEAFLKAGFAADEPIFMMIHDNDFAGLIGFTNYDRDNHKAELGYWLKEKKQKQGIVSLSVPVMLRYGFENMALNRIQIKAAAENLKSRRVAESFRFKLEGMERDGELLSSGLYTDLAVYSLLRRDMPD